MSKTLTGLYHGTMGIYNGQGSMGSVGGAGYTYGGQLTNLGVIIGGVGGTGGLSDANQMEGGGGGWGGAGVALLSGANISNASTITGGIGGLGGYGEVGGAGGWGGAGATLASGDSLDNTGAITGGAGGKAGVGIYFANFGGYGGAGVTLVSHASLINSGVITGGVGGAGGVTTGGPGGGDNGRVANYSVGYNGPGGAGVKLYSLASLDNAGTIIGGVGGGGVYTESGVGAGGRGVYAAGYGVTVTNSGTITAGGFNPAVGCSVQFGDIGDRLIVESGADFIGSIRGDGSLELAAPRGTLSGLGFAGALTGVAKASFVGFYFYDVDAGASWKLTGTNTLASGHEVMAAGSLDVLGSVSGAGRFIVTGSGTIILAAANSFTGGAEIDGGVLELAAAGAAGQGSGAGAIAFDNWTAGTATLVIEAVATPASGQTFANPIAQLDENDAIDIKGLIYAAGATAILQGDSLAVTSHGETVDFTMENLPYDPSYFVHSDGSGHVLVNDIGTPMISAASSQIIGAGRSASILGLSIAETNAASGETFTITLIDTHGLLGATGTGVTGSGGASLTITGALTQVNASLATLTDIEAAVGADKISISVTDSLGDAKASKTVAVHANGPPTIAAPASKTLRRGKATALAGVKLTEAGLTAGETFLVRVADTFGVLSAAGSGVTGSGTNSLTIHGSLAQVNAELATLKDLAPVAGTDAIFLTATDSLGDAAAGRTVAIAANGPPVLTVPTAAKIGAGKAMAIPGISLAETGSTTGEAFTVTLSDSHGLLAASGSGVTGSGTKTLTITGSLAVVDSRLATLKITEAAAGADKITLGATDGLGGVAVAKTIAVTTLAAAGQAIAFSHVAASFAAQGGAGAVISQPPSCGPANPMAPPRHGLEGPASA